MTFDWQLTTLGSITDWSSGGTPKKDEPHFWGGDIPWISANSMHSSRCFDSDLKLTEEGLKGSRLAPSDAVLLLVRGGALHNRLPVCIATRAVAFNQDVKGIIAKNQFLRPWYLLYWLMGNERFLLDSVVEYTGIGAGKLDTKRMQALEFYLPPLKVQDEIIEVAKAIDDQITLLRETNTTLENIAQSIFKSWFVDFDPVRAKSEAKLPDGMNEAIAALFPEAFEETAMGRVPVGWQISSLSSVATFQNGYAFKSSDWIEQGHPVIKIGNVKPLLIDFDGCSFVSPKTVADLDRFKLIRGDLLVGMTGYVGETGLVTRSEVSGYFNQRVGRLASSKGLDDLGFLFAAVRQAEFKAYAESQSHGSAQANVSGAELMKFSVVKPSAQVLEVFNQIVGKLIEKILNNYEEVNSLVNLRDILLPRLISGQLLVAEAEAELEKVIV